MLRGRRPKGVEVEANYGFDVQRLVPAGRDMSPAASAELSAGQHDGQLFPGHFPTWAVQPKLRQTTFFSYDNERWGLALQNNWLGQSETGHQRQWSNVCNPALDHARALNGNRQNYVKPYLKRVRHWWTRRSTAHLRVGGATADLFLNVSNVLNARAPLFPSNSGIPGLFYPTTGLSTTIWAGFTLPAFESGYREARLIREAPLKWPKSQSRRTGSFD